MAPHASEPDPPESSRSMLLGTSLTVFRGVYLDRLPPGVYEPAAASVFDTLVRFLRATVRAVAAVALVTAIGAFLGPVGSFVHRYKRWIGGAILLAAALVLATWSYPTTQVVLWIAVAVLAAFALREFLDDAGSRDGAARPGGDARARPS
ncbi:hypothetical protein HRW23_04875 [Streptomyces lunaelactis]|uniref:hypothetical protein n=1 Tax=Streptomyces lunaelactis TaxID=1535768 RepID=UPI00158461E7|nr:hypothetical protein [Streptomyces lunaelactis]NUK08575.1 hypothetical protein [Streptomyces lunaelactis]NUK32597.1 hypothetical protein [Streptomyces lunaelactis]NUK70169.1 hypothetical protein [Streptomyces lunaelactis]NUK76749.1 hypothetical protein [Streptomyces lunaelactis]NUK92016.1 hypothetical protein [Streptomyces lunaelactis]